MKSYRKLYNAVNNVILHSSDAVMNDTRRIRGCLSKMGYDTEFEAEIVAAHRRLHYYKCTYCAHYHLTKKAP